MKRHIAKSARYRSRRAPRSIPKQPASPRKSRNGSGSKKSRASRSQRRGRTNGLLSRRSGAASRNAIAERNATIEQLSALCCRLGLDELGVLAVIADRLVRGRRKYGELQIAIDRRVFAREALEEVADAAVYAAAGLIATERPRRRRGQVVKLETGDDPAVFMLGVGAACEALRGREGCRR